MVWFKVLAPKVGGGGTQVLLSIVQLGKIKSGLNQKLTSIFQASPNISKCPVLVYPVILVWLDCGPTAFIIPWEDLNLHLAE